MPLSTLLYENDLSLLAGFRFYCVVSGVNPAARRDEYTNQVGLMRT